MTTPPARPKIFHITHVENLRRIAAEGSLVSDAEMIRRGGPDQAIGMSEIKQRRVEELPVPCHPGTTVGDYVPFYFCPRSVMLYVIYMANHPDLTYRGGQGPIVHLEADMHSVIEWASRADRRWAFTLSNAGARYTEFRSSTDALGEVNWDAVEADDFRPANVKEGKQSEFLVNGDFPFRLVERIGVLSPSIERRAEEALAGAAHQPQLEVLPAWYY